MKKLPAVLIMLAFLASCVTAPTMIHVPRYIDVTQTVRLQAGMTPTMVNDLLGIPASVRGGMVIDDDAIVVVWQYNYRDQFFAIDASTHLERKVPLTGEPSRWDEELHTYELIFVDNLLMRWGFSGETWEGHEIEPIDGYIGKPQTSAAHEEPPVQSSRSGLFGR